MGGHIRSIQRFHIVGQCLHHDILRLYRSHQGFHYPVPTPNRSSSLKVLEDLLRYFLSDSCHLPSLGFVLHHSSLYPDQRSLRHRGMGASGRSSLMFKYISDSEIAQYNPRRPGYGPSVLSHRHAMEHPDGSRQENQAFHDLGCRWPHSHGRPIVLATCTI